MCSLLAVQGAHPRMGTVGTVRLVDCVKRSGGHGAAGAIVRYELSGRFGRCERGARYIPMQLYSGFGAGSFTALFPLITVGFFRSDHLYDSPIEHNVCGLPRWDAWWSWLKE